MTNWTTYSTSPYSGVVPRRLQGNGNERTGVTNETNKGVIDIMDDMQAFEQRTNETRQRIGKPPVVPYSDQRIPDDKRLYSWLDRVARLAGVE